MTSVQPTASDAPRFRYDARFANEIETRWQQQWLANDCFKTPNPGEMGFDPSRPKFYCLDMFPYPSGAGLHIGHPEGYTATDIISRYKRMKGFNVLHPMGWDAFGLPAEQYAIQTGVHPAITTRKAIDNFRRQLQRFGFSYDWSREFGTIDEDYYKWTQWIFLQLYNAWMDESAKVRECESANVGAGSPTVREGLGRARPISELEAEFASGKRAVRFNPRADEVPEADRARTFASWSTVDAPTRRRILDSYRLAYQSTTTVNWCPKLGTVLANDEVIDGKSERGGFPVLRKPLKQWMFRITAYAERLLRQLDDLEWIESTKTMQREWIGRSEGAEIDFEVVVGRLSEPTPTPSTSTSAFPADTRIPFIARTPAFVARNPYPPGEPSPDDLIKQVRNLPHLELEGATYFVTWRTDGWRLNDAGRDAVMKALLHFDSDRCDVLAACVLDTHVHWLVKPRAGHRLGDLVASVKRFSATQVNKIETMSGSLWQTEHFDHIVRDERWLGAFCAYIARNPVEAGIVARCAEYGWTYVSDAMKTGDGRSLALGVKRWRGVSGGRVEEVGVGSESRPTMKPLRVFTTRPDTLFGATYMVVAPEHELCAKVIGGDAGVDAATRDALAKYVAAAKNRSDVERQEAKEKTGAFTGLYAINPATNQQIPIWTADYVLVGYGTGAIMAVPGHDERDWEFAKKFGLPILTVVAPKPKNDHPTQGFMVNPDQPFCDEGVSVQCDGRSIAADGGMFEYQHSLFRVVDGTPSAVVRDIIINKLESAGIGTRKINYKLRDWTFSRQRYWGEPFPIVFDKEGNAYGIEASHLPVKLPELADYAPVESDDPQPLLAKARDWMHTTAGKAGVSPAILHPDTPVTRETNTMPGSAGSSWYAIRYCDAKNSQRLVGKEAEAYWMGGGGGSALRADTFQSYHSSSSPTAHDPTEAAKDGKEPARSAGPPQASGIDLYLGGSEHAVGHLLYSRFWQNVLHDLGHVSCKEPFRKLFHQGLITSFAYQRADKSIVPVDEVTEVIAGQPESGYVEIATGQRVTPIITKMSKRYKNVINPDDVINEFGADTCRLYEMYMGPLDASKPWNPRDIVGCFRFLQRAWRLCVDEVGGNLKVADGEKNLGSESRGTQTDKLLHRLTKKIGDDIERLSFNTAIAAMMEFINAVGSGLLTRAQMERFALLLAPFAPHLAEELWHKLGHGAGTRTGSVAVQSWPSFDPAMLVDDEIEVPISVMGKVRARITVATATAKDAKALEAAALADAKVQELIAGKEVKKVIVVPGKMVNLVLG